jgi:hypothetical protein
LNCLGPNPTYDLGNKEFEIIRFNSTQTGKSLHGLEHKAENKALGKYWAESDSLQDQEFWKKSGAVQV